MLQTVLKESEEKIRELESIAYTKGQTQIFIEVPYRNIQLFQAIMETCKSETLLCIATDLTSNQEMIMTKSIRAWKNNMPEINKRPTVFILYR